MPRVTRRFVLSGAASVATLGSAAATPALPIPVSYKNFGGKSLQLRPFIGRRVALLLDPARSVDRAAVDRVLSAADRAWEWYRDFFGGMPTPVSTYAGKSTIAEVPTTCGAACGYLASTGIELTPWTVDHTLKSAALNLYDQVIFYELGRNFFFFGDPLGRLHDFVTGFAHVHRFHAMDACSLAGAPWDDKYNFEDYRKAMLIGLLNIYEADKKLTWWSTLAADKCPPNDYGWSSGDFLAAAFYERIFRDHGESKYRRFWQLMRTAPVALTELDSAARFVQVAYAATGTDYRGLLKDVSLPLTIDPATATLPLQLFWSEQRQDNFTSATTDGEREAKAAGYVFVEVEGRIQSVQVPGTIPLSLYWSKQRGDNLTTTRAPEHIGAAAEGYRFVRIEGYVYRQQAPGTIPLHLYWSNARGDYFTTATEAGRANAKAAGYKYLGVEGFVRPP